MDEGESPIVIDYYSDVLCIWAWIAQPRLEELERQWGGQVAVRYRYVDIFGDTREKIPLQWGGSDGYEKFHSHVASAAEPFDHITIHPKIWTEVRPHSSASAHLALKAVGLSAGQGEMAVMAKATRQAFFADGRDIGSMPELLDIADELNLNTPGIRASLEDGSAIAALSSDQRGALDKGVKGSPTWVLNEGRQLLYGNVGYRILSANIEELLNNPADEASWC